MIDWVTIVPLIKKQIADFSGIDPYLVRWVDQPSGPLNGASPVIYLRIKDVREVGDDEERYDTSNVAAGTANNDQLTTIVGQRSFTLSIRCESFTADVTNPLSGANIIGTIKSRFSRTSAQAERSGVYNVTDWLNTMFFAFVADGVPVNVYNCDLKCVTVDLDDDLSVDAGAWIGETVGASTSILDVDGIATLTQESIDVIAK